MYKRQRVADWSTQALCSVSHTGSWRLWRTAGPATCPPRAAGHTATEPCSRTGSPGRCAWTRLLANMAHVATLAISDTYVHNSIQVISTLYKMRNTNQYQCCSLANFSWSNNAVAEHTQYYDCGPKGKSVQHTAVLKCSDCSKTNMGTVSVSGRTWGRVTLYTLWCVLNPSLNGEETAQLFQTVLTKMVWNPFTLIFLFMVKNIRACRLFQITTLVLYTMLGVMTTRVRLHLHAPLWQSMLVNSMVPSWHFLGSSLYSLGRPSGAYL